MLKKCLNCKEEFNGKPNQVCCSRKCSNEYKNPKIHCKCDICGKTLEMSRSVYDRSKHHFCSNICRAKGVGKYQSGENNPNFKNASTFIKCSMCGKEIKVLNCTMKNSDGTEKKNFYCSQTCKAEHQKIIFKEKNNPKYNGGVEFECSYCGEKAMMPMNQYMKPHKHYYCSVTCKNKHLEIISCGENNVNYKHGLSENYRERYRIIEGYNTWRRKVYERDKYKCQCCGDDRGGNLNAHHKNGYNLFPDKRTDVNNGITLCYICHKNFHMIYGNGDNTEEQFEEFLNKYVNPVVK